MAIIERCTNETINIPSQKQTLTSVAGWKPITGRILWPTTTLIRKCVLIVRASGTDERCSHYTRNYNRSRPMNRACSRRYRNLPLLHRPTLSLSKPYAAFFVSQLQIKNSWTLDLQNIISSIISTFRFLISLSFLKKD